MSNVSRTVEPSPDPAAPLPSLTQPLSSLSSARDKAAPVMREGLPPTYRMRADAHYVDQLDTPPALTVQMIRAHAIDADDLPPALSTLVDSIKLHGILEPLLVQKRERRYRLMTGRKRLAAAFAAGLQEVPCLVHRVSDDEAGDIAAAIRASTVPAAESRSSGLSALDAAVSNALAAVLSSSDLLVEATPRLTRALALEMVRAESRRALCLLEAGRVLRYGVPVERRLVSPAAVVHRVITMLGAETSLRGVGIDTSVVLADGGAIRVPEELFVHALFGAALTVAEALQGVEGARLRLSAVAEAAGTVTLAVVQQSVPVPAAWLAAEGQDPLAVVPILALRHLAEAGGGRLATTRLAEGARIAVELPLRPR